MRSFLVHVVVVLLVGFGGRFTAGQESIAASQTESEKRFDELEVSGTVIDVDGKPAEGVNISTRVADGRSTTVIYKIISETTDHAGKFRLHVHRDQLAQLALLAVAKDDRQQAYVVAPFSQMPLKEYWKEVIIQLEHAIPLTATVLDPKGLPAKGAKVWFEFPPKVPSPKSIETNDQGIVKLRVPSGLIPEAAVAQLDGVGIDYTLFRRGEDRTRPNEAKPKLEENFELRLAPPLEIPVSVIDEKGEPLPNAQVFASFRRPGMREFLRRGNMLPDWLLKSTDRQGEAMVVVPSDVDEPVSVSALLSNYSPVQRMGRMFSGNGNQPTGFLFDPAKPSKTTVILRDEGALQVTVRGTVTDRAGAPLAGASVAASGQGFQRPMPFHKAVTYTDKHGEFILSLPKNMFYLFYVENGDQTAAHRSLAIAETSPPPLFIPLEAAHPVTFRAIDAMTGEPAASSLLIVSYSAQGEYQRRFVGGPETPKIHTDSISGSRLAPTAYLQRFVTDDKGEAKLFLPSGRFQVRSFAADGPMIDERSFLVRQEAMEVEILTNADGIMLKDFRKGKPAPLAKISFEGQILDENGKPLPGASVLIQSSIPLLGADSEKLVTDAEGRFGFERDPRVTLVQAMSKDRSLAGMVHLPTKASEWKLQLAAACKVTGRFIDAKTKKPISGMAVKAQRGGPSWSTGCLVPETKTDEEGRFVLVGLAPGVNYSISTFEGTIALPSAYSETSWTSAFLEQPGEVLDLQEMFISVE